ncbi:MAG: hypothetical protein H6843_13610 [Rhodospirillaceae bacterium]|nr:hypothetical protein [Rhodospirillaceae bacterium]
MAQPETKIINTPKHVRERVEELGLDLDLLLEVRSIAVYEARKVTPFHCANASGTYAYHEGVWALRDRFVGENWRVERPDQIEVITHRKTGMRVGFQNVDLACDENNLPKPRTAKGAGAERAAQLNLFSHLPHTAKTQSGPISILYYLMVDEMGRAELTPPIVEDHTFKGAIERIFIDEQPLNDDLSLLDDISDSANDFDPEVYRKR